MRMSTRKHWRAYSTTTCLYYSLLDQYLSLILYRYGYQLNGKGKWISMVLKKPKAKGGKKVTRAGKKKEAVKETMRGDQESEDDEDDEDDMSVKSPKALSAPKPSQSLVQAVNKDSDDANLTIPMPRYNAMLAVLRNTLYM